jgi:hypothetical protein
MAAFPVTLPSLELERPLLGVSEEDYIKTVVARYKRRAEVRPVDGRAGSAQAGTKAVRRSVSRSTRSPFFQEDDLMRLRARADFP